MIIGIFGESGSGKSTVGDFMLSWGGESINFSDPLKRFCRDTFGFSEDQLWGPSELRNIPDLRFPREHTLLSDESGVLSCACCASQATEPHVQPPGNCFLTPRYALQTLGTQWGRNCHSSIWVDTAVATAQTLIDSEGFMSYTSSRGLHDDICGRHVKFVGVPDVRFLNEIHGLQAAGGKVIRLVRPSSSLPSVMALHESESGQSKIPDSVFDVVWENSKSLDHLRKIIHRTLLTWGVIPATKMPKAT